MVASCAQLGASQNQTGNIGRIKSKKIENGIKRSLKSLGTRDILLLEYENAH